MKRIIKSLLRGIWSLLTPLHRPITSRLHAYVRRSIAESLVAQTPQIRTALKHELRAGETADKEISRTLDAVLLELMRLQLQLEAIDARWEAAGTPEGTAIGIQPASRNAGSSTQIARSLAS